MDAGGSGGGSPADVPTVVFAYNRPEHLRTTLGCLHRAGLRDLIAFSDGPQDDADAERVAEVRRVLASARPREIVARDEHAGLNASIVAGLTRVFDDHDRAVVIEDDIAVAPEFGTFVRAALDRYEADETVAGVTGLRQPFSRRCLRGYAYDAFAIPRFHSWGWATWRRAWNRFEFDAGRLRTRLRDAAVDPASAGSDVPRMLRRALETGELRDAWDVLCTANVLANRQVFVAPTWNMVEHRGAEGTHHRGRQRRVATWEPRFRPDLAQLRFPPPQLEPRIAECYRRFPDDDRLSDRLRKLVPAPVRARARALRP